MFCNHMSKYVTYRGLLVSAAKILTAKTILLKRSYQPPFLSKQISTKLFGILKSRWRFINRTGGILYYTLTKETKSIILLLLLVTRPLPRDGSVVEDHGAQETGQLPRIWTRGCKETESRQRVSGAKSP